MTSLLMDDDRALKKMKPKSSNEKIAIDGGARTIVRDETRSFLNFSRENLSISNSELEQGFNKPSKCFRPGRHNVLSLVAIFVALVCAGVEIWKLHRVISNTKEIEIIKRDVENLRRLFGEDFMDELLRNFEEQLYADMSDTDKDSDEEDIEGTDYDANYGEDYSQTWGDYAADSLEATTSSSLKIQDLASSLKNEELRSTSSSNRERLEMLAVLHKVEAKRDQQDEENHENPNEKHSLDETHPKRRRAVTDEIPHSRSEHNHTRKENLRNESNNSRSSRRKKKIAEMPWDRHPPKKYFAVTRLENSEDMPTSSQKRHSSRMNHSREKRRQVPELARSLKQRVITRRHLRAPRQVFAAHYGADSTLFTTDDEHTGNGRAKHNEGVFKAWRPSDWVSELSMNKHFTLSRDGKLTVHESGLYLVYAQIHYLDEHDENGFHILVNGQPILQCMDYSPGTGHKSRSCFSAQVTILRAGDHLILKDVGPARYTLFQQDKSFFGLARLGDSRQQQQQPRHTTPIPEY